MFILKLLLQNDIIRQSMYQKIIFGILAVVFALHFTACLKNRAHYREDSEQEESKAIPVHPVQDVEPKGEYAIDELRSEFTQLSGRIEDLERNKTQGMPSSDDIKKLETRIQQLEQNQATLMESIHKTQSAPSAEEVTELYNSGVSHFEDTDYEGAIASFDSYLKSPKAKKVEDATYFKAESYYRLKEYKKAIVEFSKFPEKFRRSTKMPEVLYKIGLSFDALGMKDDAKGFFQELVEKFPKSAEAKRARKRVK